MRLGVMADVHGNDVALRAVLDDAASCHVDRWWVLGDLVLFGLVQRLLAGCAADVVIGGHTHIAADRLAGRIRALNPGSTGIPERPGEASWLLLDCGDGLEHPNAELMAAILTGRRQQIQAPAASDAGTRR
jgi:predicted phosphodiesterase